MQRVSLMEQQIKASQILIDSSPNDHIQIKYDKECNVKLVTYDALSYLGYETPKYCNTAEAHIDIVKFLWKTFGIFTTGFVKCPIDPVCQHRANLGLMIKHLNSDHDWSFTKIGKFLEEIGY